MLYLYDIKNFVENYSLIRFNFTDKSFNCLNNMLVCFCAKQILENKTLKIVLMIFSNTRITLIINLTTAKYMDDEIRWPTDQIVYKFLNNSSTQFLNLILSIVRREKLQFCFHRNGYKA